MRCGAGSMRCCLTILHTVEAPTRQPRPASSAVAPGGVVGGHFEDETTKRAGGGWSARRSRGLGPVSGGSPPVPAQQGLWRHEPASSPRSGQGRRDSTQQGPGPRRPAAIGCRGGAARRAGAIGRWDRKLGSQVLPRGQRALVHDPRDAVAAHDDLLQVSMDAAPAVLDGIVLVVLCCCVDEQRLEGEGANPIPEQCPDPDSCAQRQGSSEAGTQRFDELVVRRDRQEGF